MGASVWRQRSPVFWIFSHIIYGFVVSGIAVYRQTAGQVMGYSTLENILHCKVVSWEPELPETRIVTIRTPCYVYVDILPNMKSIFSVPVVPVIPFSGEKTVFHACGV